MTMFPILTPADLASIPVRQFLLFKHGLATPDLIKDERGVPRIET
ncbi:hypothetical protein [Pseudomonas syringae]|nr:hypothetical protein [Pseudomonas syringae]